MYNFLVLHLKLKLLTMLVMFLRISLLLLVSPNILAQTIMSNVDSLHKVYEKNPTVRNQVILYNALSFKLRNSDIKNAKLYAEKALHMAKSIGDSLHIAESMGLLGILYYRVGEYEDAIIFHFRSLKIAEELNLQQMVAFRYNDIANIYTEQSRYQQALVYHTKSLEIKKQLQDWEGVATSYNNLCNVHLNLKEYEKADEYLQKSIAIAQTHSFPRSLGISYTYLGEIYKAQKNYEKALHYHLKAMQLKKSVNDVHSYLYNIYSIGTVYSAQKNYKEALKNYQQALDSASDIQSRRRMQVAYEAIAQTYAAMGNYKKAYEYEQKYAQLSDALFHERHDKQVELLETQYDAEKKDAELQILRKDNEIQEQNSTKQEFALYFSVVIVLLLILFMLLLYKHLNEKKMAYLKLQVNNKELSNQKMQIEYQKEELMMRNEQLAELNRETEGLMSVVAHDLRAPLNRILGVTQIMRYEDFFNPMVAEYLQMIDKNCDSGINLIRDVLLVHNVESANIKIAITELNLSEFLVNHLKQFDAQVQNKHIQLLLQVPPTDIILRTDEGSLVRIIDNLVSNAIKFSHPESTVTVSVAQEKPFVRIAIKDEGLGIKPEEQHKLFKKFQRLSARPTGGEDSTGLGLSIVKALVEKLKGSIKVESMLNKGTTFTIVLQDYM